MSKKTNGQKPQSPPKQIELSREDTLELKYLNEATRRIQLQMARLQEENSKIQKETLDMQAKLLKEHKVDVLANYALDLETQKANLREDTQAPAPVIETEVVADEEAPEPVASA